MDQDEIQVPAERETEPMPEKETDADSRPRSAGADRVPVDVKGVFAFPNPDRSKWNIRFIDTAYNTLFTIPDGASVTLTRYDGKEETFPCHYIDDTHFEAFGEVWHIYQFAEMMERSGNTYRPKYPLPGDITDTYEIYQLKDSCDTAYEFMPYEYARGKIQPEHYGRAYAGVLAPKMTLENIFAKHNLDHRPRAQYMRSLSMSDIVVLNRAGERQAFYVDRIGFTECREFLKPSQKEKRKRRNPQR